MPASLEIWSPDRLRCLSATVRMQAWPISDQVKSALDSAAKQIEELELPPPQDMLHYRTQAEAMIGFARCGYLDRRTYDRLVTVLAESLAETAMVIQEFMDQANHSSLGEAAPSEAHTQDSSSRT